MRPMLSMWRVWLAWLAWSVLLGCLPWWLGLPLLLAIAIGLLSLQHRLTGDHAGAMRSALRWGLPGVLFALQRALGGDAFAWGAALLGALVGFTLLAGLEAWLDRDRRREPSQENQAEWPELAMAPIGPMVSIIELQPPCWQPLDSAPSELLAGQRVADAIEIDAREEWIALRLRDERGIVLLHRPRQRQHRLRGWQLAGWHDAEPWLMRHAHSMPLALSDLLQHRPEE
jgi:hypothetical protein